MPISFPEDLDNSANLTQDTTPTKIFGPRNHRFYRKPDILERLLPMKALRLTFRKEQVTPVTSLEEDGKILASALSLAFPKQTLVELKKRLPDG